MPQENQPQISAAGSSVISTRWYQSLWFRLCWKLACVYLILVLMLIYIQRSLIYQPRRAETISPLEAGLSEQRVHEIEVKADDGLTLHGWYVPAAGHACQNDEQYRQQLDQGRPVAIVFCGNAGHRAHRGDILSLFSGVGVDSLIFDYRGYGVNGGSPHEQGIIGDSRSIWRHLTESHGVAAERIVIFGESLGGGVATQLAAYACQAEEFPRALILQATFSTLVDAAGYHYPWLPVNWALVDRYESIQVIPQVNCPILHIHGSADEIVPYRLGKRLFQAAPPASRNGIEKQFVELPGVGHNNIDRSPSSTFAEELRGFLSRIDN